MVLIKINGISAFYFSGNSISAVVWTKYTQRTNKWKNMHFCILACMSMAGYSIADKFERSFLFFVLKNSEGN